jgi:hypothetical protein
MVGSNVSIEDEDNLMLANYAKNIGPTMRGIRVFIFEKCHCKNNYYIGKIVSKGLIDHYVPCQAIFLFHPTYLLHVRKMGGVSFGKKLCAIPLFDWVFYLFDVNIILICIKLLSHMYVAIP